ncbi:hypothetical protein CBP36_19800 (plasmid) [Acidovorax carolinensis]|uniref:Uncharacterized protein n=1 Tax=Acidovorax carolinensis TaxID=553814 RepID=A0A240UJI5_9BURK|nr:hypothetical protein [Acidovorax carolinensis]ART57153.1 hypothetical protein CBP35_19765 [Acidovorax carolinensis]ART61212.1 hypothetical protein CBP36_19800 [Acidovorax carolinensis]
MERKSLFTRPAARAAQSLTFAFTVDSYDLSKLPHVVHGVRLDTQEPVTVFLRDIDFQLKGRYKRSEIANFHEPRKDRQHPGTVPGGILLAQDAQAQSDGTFAARWLQSLSHTPGEAEVFHTTVHVSVVKTGRNDRPYSMMTMLHDGNFTTLSREMADLMKITQPFKIENSSELKEALASLLDDGVGCGVRVSSEEGFDAMYVAKRKEDSGEKAADNFLASIKELIPSIDDGSFSCEVIPYSNVWAGPATIDTMLKNKVVQSRIDRFNEVGTRDNGQHYTVPVFRPAIVAVRASNASETGGRIAYFSHFEPLFTREPVKGLVNAICYAQSDTFAPEVPRENRQGNNPQAGAPSPAQAAEPSRAPAQKTAPQQSRNDIPTTSPSGFTGADSFDAFADSDDMPFSDDPLMMGADQDPIANLVNDAIAEASSGVRRQEPSQQHQHQEVAPSAAPTADTDAAPRRRYAGRRG